jgi:predicted hydrocarbon binding protein
MPAERRKSVSKTTVDPFPSFLPNKVGHFILLALEDTLGQRGAGTILDAAGLSDLIGDYPPDNQLSGFPSSHIAAICETLDTVYGSRGGQGIALRMGRECFKYALRELGPQLGLSDPVFRLLPLKAKLAAASQAVAGALNRQGRRVAGVAISPQSLRLSITGCPLCEGRSAESPCCHLMVGLLQESLYWISGGRQYQVEERNCCAQGNTTCTFLIHLQPLE